MYKSIWIIDDDETNLFIAARLIKQNGSFHTITTYNTAQEALKYIASHQDSKNDLPDIILLDLNMPVMDGWQFLEMFEILRTSLAKDIDIYILSSSINSRDVQRSENLAATRGFLSKPLSDIMIAELKMPLADAS